MPILANIHLQSSQGVLTLTATDLEIELTTQIEASINEEFQTTLPARKLLDITKALVNGTDIQFNFGDNQVEIVSGRSRFTLATLPATDFPSLDKFSEEYSFTIPQDQLKALLDKTSFAMGHQDVRFYLNGLLMEINTHSIKLVGTDGHRLALCEFATEQGNEFERKIIIPRKGVLELSKLLESDASLLRIVLSQNHVRVIAGKMIFTSKLIEGTFPNYYRVIPAESNKIMEVNREALKQAMNRIAILSNEKYRGIQLRVSTGNLSMHANNPDHEEAEESLEVVYSEEALDIGFNVTYMIDALSVLDTENVHIKFKDNGSSCIITEPEDSSSLFVVMPMRL